MRIRHLLVLLVAGAAVTMGGMLLVSRGPDEILLMVAAIAALAALYLSRSYAHASLTADSRPAPHPVAPRTAESEEAPGDRGPVRVHPAR